MGEAEAAVAIVHAGMPHESVLLMRRSERVDDSWSGHWSFPGGRRDVEDRDLLTTALRELEEECGIRLSPAQLRTALPCRMAGRRVGRFLQVAPYVFEVDCEASTKLDAREAVESVWVPLDRLRDPAQHALRPVPGLPRETLFPAIELNGVPLWGFTYRVITDWLEMAPKADPAEGFAAACTVLEFLRSQGLEQQQGWEERGRARTARMRGEIPVAAVVSHFTDAARYLPAVHCLEARGECVRLVGPTLEEYFIYGSR